MSTAPERSPPGDGREGAWPGRLRLRSVAPAGPAPHAEEPPGRPPDRSPPSAGGPSDTAGLQCRRCQKAIVDQEMEIYFTRTGLCFWCAYVDSQG